MQKQWLINLSLILFSSFIALAIAEGLLILFLPTATQRVIYDQTRDVFQYNPHHIQFDSYAGYITKPNLMAPFNNREFNTTVQTNSMGFRDDETSLQDPDVLILGDSFGFGWGVENNETLEAILEKESKLNILNMSVSGYNNIQELALLEKWRQTHSLKDKTILLLYYANDMITNVDDKSGIYPTTHKEGDSIIIKPVTLTAYNQWISGAHTTLGNLLVRRFYSMYYLKNAYSRLRAIWDKHSDTENSANNYSGDKIEIFRMVLEKLQNMCQKEKCKIVIAYIPYTPYLKNEEYAKEYFFVKHLVSSYNIGFIDLSNIVGQNGYYLLDEHWNTNGHQKAALEIEKYL